MEKLRSDGRARLVVSGHYAAFRSTGSRANDYWLDTGDGATPLAGVQWAEWAADGMLLVPGPAPPPTDARLW